MVSWVVCLRLFGVKSMVFVNGFSLLWVLVRRCDCVSVVVMRDGLCFLLCSCLLSVIVVCLLYGGNDFSSVYFLGVSSECMLVRLVMEGG